MYEEELSTPLYEMEKTYDMFKKLCEENKGKFVDFPIDWVRIDQKYHQAKEQLLKIMPFEKQLEEVYMRNHQERAKIFQEYIEKCRSYLNEKTVQVLYERMVTDCCLDGKICRFLCVFSRCFSRKQ